MPTGGAPHALGPPESRRPSPARRSAIGASRPARSPGRPRPPGPTPGCWHRSWRRPRASGWGRVSPQTLCGEIRAGQLASGPAPRTWPSA
eukprot:9418511-Pyramimonas_sp.AAC.1